MLVLFSPFPPQLKHLVEAHKRSSRHMMKQLQEVTCSYNEALHRLQEQEKSHRAFICRSNSLTTLLKHDTERLVQQTQDIQMDAQAKTTLMFCIYTPMLVYTDARLVKISTHAFQKEDFTASTREAKGLKYFSTLEQDLMGQTWALMYTCEGLNSFSLCWCVKLLTAEWVAATNTYVDKTVCSFPLKK